MINKAFCKLTQGTYMTRCQMRTLENWPMKSNPTRYLWWFKCCPVKQTSETFSNRIISPRRVILNFMYTCGLLLNSKMFCKLNRFLFSVEMDGSDRGIPLNSWLVWFSFWDSADLTWKFYGSLLISLVNKVGSLVLKSASVCVTPYVAWHERLGNWMLRDVKTIPQNFVPTTQRS